MNFTNFTQLSWVLFITLFFVACTKEEEKVIIEVSNFTISMDENPNNGKALGKITATTNKGELEYNLTAQSPAGALALDGTNGNLSVLDNNLFDYEARTSITATVTVTNEGVSKSANIIITLKDVAESTGGGTTGGGTTGGGTTGGGTTGGGTTGGGTTVTDPRDKFVGTWTVTETCSSSGTLSYTTTITKNTTDSTKVNISNFWNVFTNTVVADISGNTITIGLQEPDNDGFTVKSTGTSNTISSNGLSISLDYEVKDTSNGSTDACTSTWAK